ncbi:MAG: thioredoxin family protein [bacterium]|nr:thioredoxin family protein [bacterium]
MKKHERTLAMKKRTVGTNTLRIGTMVSFLFAVTLGLMPVMAIDLPEGAKVGDAAPDFILKNTDDKRVGLASYAEAKGIILVFTCNTCPYSVKYENRIIALNEKFSKKGFPVVAINSNDPSVMPDDAPDHMKQRALDKKFTFPYLFDETQSVAKAYGARRTPHVYVLQRTPRGFSIEYIGAIDEDPDEEQAARPMFVDKAVEALLAGKKPEPSFTKAIGCTIKWKKS